MRMERCVASIGDSFIVLTGLVGNPCRFHMIDCLCSPDRAFSRCPENENRVLHQQYSTKGAETNTIYFNDLKDLDKRIKVIYFEVVAVVAINSDLTLS